MIAIKMTFTQKGRDIAAFRADLGQAMENALSKGLEIVRLNLLDEAPRGQYTQKNPRPNRGHGSYTLAGYLAYGRLCTRKTRAQGLITSGEIFFNEKYVPQINFVVNPVKAHTIPHKVQPYLKFWWVKENKWFRGFSVWHKTKPANNFIERAYWKSAPYVTLAYTEELIKVTQFF